MDAYRSLLEVANLVPTLAQQQQAAAQSAEMSDIMRQLLATQATLAEIGKTNTDTAKKQVDAITAAKGPRPTQPSFAPKGEHSDYLEFKAFTQKFSYFTKDVKDNKD